MIVKEIKLPNNYKKFFSSENKITEVIEDYIEKKQDEKLKTEINNSKILLNIDNELRQVLWIS